MSDLIAVTGNITVPPALHGTGGGVPMVTFGLASTERRFENGTWRDGHTNFYNVSAFRTLAEHAFASFEKGQRVIVMGKLRVRRWEANGRSGTSIDLEATSLGPDVKFGVASFVKDAPARSTYDAPRDDLRSDDPRDEDAPGDEGSPYGAPLQGPSGWAPEGVDAMTGEVISTSVPDHADTSVAPTADGGQLVAAGGWGPAPGSEEDPPF